MEMLASADMAWTHILGDDFSIDDLLVEPEQQGFDQEVEADSFETSNHNSSTSSSPVASFELQQHNPCIQLDFHTEEVAELEWVSRFIDDSFFEFPSSEGKNQSSATPTTTNLLPERPIMVPVKARSKRSRKSSFACSSNSCTRNPDMFVLETGATKAKKRRGRKRKNQLQLGSSKERKCSHCGVEKTPQWRSGPMGAKTLCNACGVRFKSGRLLPEYRPASSPTYVSNVHSNSHRKVLEMRRKKEEEEQFSSSHSGWI